MASRSKSMTAGSLATLLDSQITDAVAYDKSDLASLRIRALEYFEGTLKDVPAQTGRSSVVSKDFSDTHGWIMPGLLRVFLGSDRVAVYEPRRQNAEEAAKQATDFINYVVLSECDGYRILHGAIHDGLALGNGIIKHWWDETPEYTTESFTGLTDDLYTQIVAHDDVEKVLEHSEYPDPAAGGMGAPQPQGDPALAIAGQGAALQPEARGGAAQLGDGAQGIGAGPAGDAGLGGLAGMGHPRDPAVSLLHDCKIKRITSRGRLNVEVVPPEEFLIERNATSLTEDACRFVAHRRLRTRSSLIKEGFDRAKVDEIESYGSTQINDGEKTARETLTYNLGDTASDRSVELIEVFECYVLVDYDGDGVAEWRKVVMAGGIGERQMLANDEWGDDLPFTDLAPDPIPHRWRGRSLFEEVEDIQRVKTVLLRGALDNLYWVNNPQREAVIDQIESVDELNSPSFNGTVWVRQKGMITPLEVPFVADKAFVGFDKMDQIKEFRTGVSASTMALDPQALANQTATAVNAQQSASYSKVETYARNIAEIGLKRLFKCLLRLIVKHQDKPRTIRLRGKWVEMDPRSWDADMDVTINTGLGSGSRDRDMAMLNGVLTKQENILQLMGPTNPIVPLDKYRDTLAKMAEAAGLKSPEQFFAEITPEIMAQMKQQASQQKPDPKMAEVQAKVQAQQAQMQAEMQMKQQQAQVDAQSRQQELQAKLQNDVQRMQLEHQMNTERMNREFALKQEELKANMGLKVQELQLEAQLKREQMVYTANTQAASNIQEAESM